MTAEHPLLTSNQKLTLEKLTREVESFIDGLLPHDTPETEFDSAVGEVIHALLPFTVERSQS